MVGVYRRGPGWRYDFFVNGTRYWNTANIDKAFFKTKISAQRAEVKRRERIEGFKEKITFLSLIKERLSFITNYQTEESLIKHSLYTRKWLDFMGVKTLAEDIDINMSPNRIANTLNRAEFAKFRHKVEGDFYTGDILMRDELPRLYEMLRGS